MSLGCVPLVPNVIGSFYTSFPGDVKELLFIWDLTLCVFVFLFFLTLLEDSHL